MKKKFLNQSKPITLAIGIISTVIVIGLTLVESGSLDLIIISEYTNPYRRGSGPTTSYKLSEEILIIILCWSPYLIFKIYEIYEKNNLK